MQRFFPRIFYGWVMVGASLAINVATSPLNAVVFSFLIGPVSSDLGVSKSALAWAMTLRLGVAGVTGPVLGILLDRHGSRWVGAICGAIGGVALIALGRVDTLWAVYGLFAFSGLAGFGGPGGQLLTQVSLAKWFVARRGRALALATTGVAVGTTITAPLTPWLVQSLGWRTTTTIFGVIVIAVVVPASLLFMRRQPEDLGLEPDGGATSPDPAAAVRTGHLITLRDWTVSEALRTPAMWLLLTAMTAAGTVLMGTLVYRVDYFESTGMSASLVGFGTALDPFFVIFSVLIFGSMADRFAIRYVGAIGLGGLALSMLPMVVTRGEVWTIVAHNSLWGIAAGAWITLNSMVWPNYFGREYVGAIRGIVLPVSIAASAAGAPLFGYLLDSGLAPATVWSIGCGGFALGATLVLFARPPAAPAAAMTAAGVP